MPIGPSGPTSVLFGSYRSRSRPLTRRQPSQIRSSPTFRLLPSIPGRMKSAGNSAALAAGRDGRDARTPVDDCPAHESGPITLNPSGDVSLSLVSALTTADAV